MICRISSESENAFGDFIQSLTQPKIPEHFSANADTKANEPPLPEPEINTKQYAYEIDGRSVTVEAKTKAEALARALMERVKEEKQ